MARWAIIFVMAMSGFLSLGQTRPRDYVISLPRVSFSADGRVAIVSFTVSNQGGDAIDASQVLIRESLESSVEVSAELPALASGGEQNYRIELRLAELPATDLHFEVEAGIDAYELAGSDIARNNKQIFRINQADIGNAPVDEGTAAPEYDLLLPVLNLGIDILPDGIALNGQAFPPGGFAAPGWLDAAGAFLSVAAEPGIALDPARDAKVRQLAAALCRQRLA